MHDLLHQRNQSHASVVAAPEALDRQVRVDVAQRVGAALQLVIEVREPAVELVAELGADQAGRRGVDGQLGEEVQQVDLAFVAPVLDHPATSSSMVAAWPFICSPRSAELCSISFRRRAGVEHHTFAEDRRHKRVGLGLVEIRVGRAEEELVRLGPRQEDDVLVDELKPAHVTALVADALHQTDRVGAELLEVAMFFLATRNPLYFL